MKRIGSRDIVSVTTPIEVGVFGGTQSRLNRAFVPHPIQDRTDAELRKLAEEHFPSIVALLLKGNT